MNNTKITSLDGLPAKIRNPMNPDDYVGITSLEGIPTRIAAYDGIQGSVAPIDKFDIPSDVADTLYEPRPIGGILGSTRHKHYLTQHAGVFHISENWLGGAALCGTITTGGVGFPLSVWNMKSPLANNLEFCPACDQLAREQGASLPLSQD